ncbi:hypothetical protein ASE74_19600 [Pedobacter sp. Leaf216]|nr:hypothetical protein ASE74_19600 [Pedobacter sp. Leaf216]
MVFFFSIPVPCEWILLVRKSELRINPAVRWNKPKVLRKMDLDPKCIFVQGKRNLDVHYPVIKLMASLARNRGVTSLKYTL